MIEVLLVDDESYVTESLDKTIPWSSLDVHRVYCADSAAAALERLEEQPIDIVVTDIRMPEMDGLELIRIIALKWPNIRCILLTGHSDFEYAKRAIRLQAFDYLLKPVNDDEFMITLSNAIESLREEWKESDRHHQVLYNMKSDRSVMQEMLMRDLLLGRQLSRDMLDDKLTQYEISLRHDDLTFLMLVQLGEPFVGYETHSLSLIEYAVGNIAQEVLSPLYRVWHSKGPHDCIVIVAAVGKETQLAGSGSGDKSHRAQLEVFAESFRLKVGEYLKGEMTAVISPRFIFPGELSVAYSGSLSALYRHGQKLASTIIFQEDVLGSGMFVKSIDTLYRPPTLIHLLESKQWEAAAEKINEVFGFLEGTPVTREHRYESFLSITNAFLYVVHKHGLMIHEIDPSGLDLLLDRSALHSLDKLRKWALGMLSKLEIQLSESESFTKSRIVGQVQDIVSKDGSHELSVKMIADKVFLHPVYLSKVYKSETGEGLGDYLIRIRMEKALYMLKHTNKKIYEITTELGYQNPQYFSKIFRKFYGMAPNEYRD
jgi:two-component system response regulator YesN